MDKPIDRLHAGESSDSESTVPMRRPWHAPQFIVTEATATDHFSATNTDGSAAQS